MADTIGVVQEFYSALGAGDVTRAVAVLSPDLEWTEAEGFPYYSGIWRGPQAVVDKFLVPSARDWTVFSVTPHESSPRTSALFHSVLTRALSVPQVEACPLPSRIDGWCAPVKSFDSTCTRTR